MRCLFVHLSVILICLASSVTADLIVIDVDNSQMQGGNRRIFPQIENAANHFALDGSTFDHTFQFSQMECLHANQDFTFGLTIFLDTTAALNPPTQFNATWQFLDASLNPIPNGSFSNLQVDYRDPPTAVPRLELSGQTLAAGVEMGLMGWDFYGIRVSATLPDLVTMAAPSLITVLSPNPAIQEGAEFALSGASGGAWEISTVPEPSPFLMLLVAGVSVWGFQGRRRPVIQRDPA